MSFHYKKTCVTTLILLVSILLGTACTNQKPAFEVRLVTQEGTTLPLWDKSGEVYLSSDAIVTAKDIATVQLEKEPESDRLVLKVQLEKSAIQKFAKFTEKHIGEQLAIVANGHVLDTPYLRGPILEGKIALTAPSNAETGELYQLLEGF